MAKHYEGEKKKSYLAYKIIIGAVVIALIILIWLAYRNEESYKSYIPKIEKELLNKGPCSNLSYDEENLCWALENKTTAFCDRIDATTKKYYCYGSVAEKLNDPGICEEINTRETRFTCYNQLAMLKKDTGICDSKVADPYWKAQCYTYVAIKYTDEGICEGLTNNYYRSQCVNSVSAAKG